MFFQTTTVPCFGTEKWSAASCVADRVPATGVAFGAVVAPFGAGLGVEACAAACVPRMPAATEAIPPSAVKKRSFIKALFRSRSSIFGAN